MPQAVVFAEDHTEAPCRQLPAAAVLSAIADLPAVGLLPLVPLGGTGLLTADGRSNRQLTSLPHPEAPGPS